MSARYDNFFIYKNTSHHDTYDTDKIELLYKQSSSG